MSVSNASPYATKLPSKSSCQFQQQTQNPSSDTTFPSPLDSPSSPPNPNRSTHPSRPSHLPWWPISAPLSTSSDAPSTNRRLVSLSVDPQVHFRKIFIFKIFVYNNSTKLSKNPLWNCAGIAAIDRGHEGARHMLYRMIGISVYCWMLDDRERGYNSKNIQYNFKKELKKKSEKKRVYWTIKITVGAFHSFPLLLSVSYFLPSFSSGCALFLCHSNQHNESFSHRSTSTRWRRHRAQFTNPKPQLSMHPFRASQSNHRAWSPSLFRAHVSRLI